MGKYYRPFHFGGKLGMHKTLSKNKLLKKYVPETKNFTYRNVKEMMKKYRIVYVKPQKSSKGRGIYRIRRVKTKYECRSNKSKKVFKKLASVYNYITKHSKKKKRIIQQAITLDRVKGRPYDIRALVQRKVKGKWKCTGISSRIGKKNSIVTNLNRGGSICLMPDLFKQKGLSVSAQKQRMQEMKDTALHTARFLSEKNENIHVLGIDYGYDKAGKLWILEVNSRPQFSMLKKVDPAMYKRMKRLAKSYKAA
ncbi:YheC/D like ATP-grasp [Alteribacillus persepolensis]|uniref:YheC/D like ATP-grasp n=1 Tax=Alteribacillus persepolensis TaxID=568899 RepID=A0A1G7Y6R5_9BACI|nr:YheC/YheD family protein [Alteribacillus persepolensis]SDG92152.1 YheC/D like ATP-grasp [Alteribacillus persepolensis]